MLLSVYFFLFLFLSAEEMAGRSSSRASVLSNPLSDRLHTVSERSRPNSPDPLKSAVTEMFISEENISRMENILDTWSNNLKVSLLPHSLLPQLINLMALISCLPEKWP